jgi:hypothetical protein
VIKRHPTEHQVMLARIVRSLEIDERYSATRSLRETRARLQTLAGKMQAELEKARAHRAFGGEA